MNSSQTSAPDLRAACGHEHLVEFYETDAFLVGTVADFVVPALRGQDAVIVVATAEHREAFAAAIRDAGIDLDTAMWDRRYQPLDAADLLSAFMVDGRPDPDRFQEVAGAVIDRATAGGRTVKVYGEMVALLWADGDVTSTIALEDLWNDLAATRSFALLCAYPLQGFDDDARAAFKRICTQHSQVVPAVRSHRSAASLGERRRMLSELQQETAALRTELSRLRAAQAGG